MQWLEHTDTILSNENIIVAHVWNVTLTTGITFLVSPRWLTCLATSKLHSGFRYSNHLSGVDKQRQLYDLLRFVPTFKQGKQIFSKIFNLGSQDQPYLLDLAGYSTDAVPFLQKKKKKDV